MRGIPASEGIAIGKVFLYLAEEPVVEKKSIIDSDKEIEKLKTAVAKTKEQLTGIMNKVLETMGKEEAQVFEAHLLVLEDPEWIGKIEKIIIKELLCSEYVVQSVTEEFIIIFESMDNEYLKARSADLKDVSGRLINNILGVNSGLKDLGDNPVVIIARDLTPSDTAQLDKSKVLGFITEQGNKTSHSAIIARTMGIPALVGALGIVEEIKCKTNNVENNLLDVVIAFDGNSGEIQINPDSRTLNDFKNKATLLEEERRRNESVRGEESITADGFKIEIACNIAKSNEADFVNEHDGEGVGLFRSEFLFMDRDKAPDEEEQFIAYKTAAEKLQGKPLIIRTLDAGGDKHISYLNIGEEMNPFLGYRAIRICLDDVDLFRTQIKAILRASAFGNIKMMFPMIATVDEFLRSKAIVNEEMNLLKQSGTSFNEKMELGIMVEIPSTAVMADIFAKYVDFFSIGTNDLTQYTLAADRMNPKLQTLYNHRNPAVLRLIKNVINGAQSQGKWVGMCGEAAADPIMVPILLGLGLNEFSMAPSSVLRTRRLVKSLFKSDCEKLAEKVLNMHDVADIENKVKEFLESRSDY